jgi:hypothetical protein
MLATSFYKASLLLNSAFLGRREFIRGSSSKILLFLMAPKKHHLAVNLVSKSDD